MTKQTSKDEVRIIIDSLTNLCKGISSNLPFDRRKVTHKFWYEQLENLFSSLHNCQILENPSSNNILSASLVLIPEEARREKDELTLPNCIYFHLRKDMRICLQPEDSYLTNNILEKDSIDSYDVMLKKIQQLVEQYQF